MPCVLGIGGVIEMMKTVEEDKVVEKLQTSAASVSDLQQKLKLWLPGNHRFLFLKYLRFAEKVFNDQPGPISNSHSVETSLNIVTKDR